MRPLRPCFFPQWDKLSHCTSPHEKMSSMLAGMWKKHVLQKKKKMVILQIRLASNHDWLQHIWNIYLLTNLGLPLNNLWNYFLTLKSMHKNSCWENLQDQLGYGCCRMDEDVWKPYSVTITPHTFLWIQTNVCTFLPCELRQLYRCHWELNPKMRWWVHALMLG